MNKNLALTLFKHYFNNINENIKNIKIGLKELEIAKEKIKEILKTGNLNIINNISLNIFRAERAIIYSTKSPYIINRVAIAYSKALTEMDKKGALELAKLFNFNVYEKGNLFFIDLISYLNNCPESQEYKLFYLNIEKGFVQLNEKKFMRFLQEAIKKRLTKLGENEADKRADEFAEELKEHIPKPKVSIKTEKPPCIEAILNQLYAHDNLPHYSRWVLGVYLINIGMDINDIVKIYENLPDFNEKITRYQLEHIKSKNYKMPSCEKMLIYGLRQNECPCNKGLIENPLSYKKENKKS